MVVCLLPSQLGLNHPPSDLVPRSSENSKPTFLPLDSHSALYHLPHPHTVSPLTSVTRSISYLFTQIFLILFFLSFRPHFIIRCVQQRACCTHLPVCVTRQEEKTEAEARKNLRQILPPDRRISPSPPKKKSTCLPQRPVLASSDLVSSQCASLARLTFSLASSEYPESKAPPYCDCLPLSFREPPSSRTASAPVIFLPNCVDHFVVISRSYPAALRTSPRPLPQTLHIEYKVLRRRSRHDGRHGRQFA